MGGKSCAIYLGGGSDGAPTGKASILVSSFATFEGKCSRKAVEETPRHRGTRFQRVWWETVRPIPVDIASSRNMIRVVSDPKNRLPIDGFNSDVAIARVRDLMRVKLYSIKTEQAYLRWIKDDVPFHQKCLRDWEQRSQPIRSLIPIRSSRGRGCWN